MTAPAILKAAASGACPGCGARTLFAGAIRFASRCRACGLDFDQFNVGDGPAAFLILIVGAVLVVAALVLDAAVEPPLWVHFVWIPVGLALTLGGLRFGKSFLLQQEYRQRAGEGQLAQ